MGREARQKRVRRMTAVPVVLERGLFFELVAVTQAIELRKAEIRALTATLDGDLKVMEPKRQAVLALIREQHSDFINSITYRFDEPTCSLVPDGQS